MPIITHLGPVPIKSIVLCAADGPRSSQRDMPDDAAHFFPGAAWVAAVGAAANRTGAAFTVMTTGHGLVRAREVIAPYDLSLATHGYEVGVYLRTTVPMVLARRRHSLLLFYAGGSSRDAYLGCLLPLLRPLGISVLSFGRPSVVDADQIEPVVHALTAGTTLESIAGRLKHPNRLQFHYHP